MAYEEKRERSKTEGERDVEELTEQNYWAKRETPIAEESTKPVADQTPGERHRGGPLPNEKK